MPGFPPGVHRIGGRNAAPIHRQAAHDFYTPILPVVAEMHRQGLSLRAIARELDRREIRTRTGCYYFPKGLHWGEPVFIRWSATQVRRGPARAAQAGPAAS